MGYINRHKVFFAVQRQVYPANFQEKTITPNTFQREITPDVGYDALSKVKLNGILVDAHTEIESQVDSDVKYQKNVPAGALQYAGLNKVGGMSYKFNQLISSTKQINFNQNGITATWNNNTLTLNGTATATVDASVVREISTIANHKYLIFSTLIGGSGSFQSGYELYSYGSNVGTFIGNAIGQSSGNGSLSIYFIIQSGLTINQNIYINIFDLTDMYGAGNEPTTVAEFKARFNKDYYDYTLSTLHHSPVTSVVSNETLNIPAQVQLLNGYGMGVNVDCNNYIDFGSKKFKQIVGFVKAKDLNWNKDTDGDNWAFYTTGISNIKLPIDAYHRSNLLSIYKNVIAQDNITYSNDKVIFVKQNRQVFIVDKTYSNTTDFVNHFTDNDYILFELETPVETDISEYITQDTLDVSNTITFNNEYEQAVPSEINYLIEV